jgi:hypothetical protein
VHLKIQKLFRSHHLLTLKLYKWPNRPIRRVWVTLSKPTKKSNRDILDMLSKPKTPGHCGFPLANLHKGKSLHNVPPPIPQLAA